MANPMTLGNMYKVYLKPSMGGQLILRSPRSNQRSAAVKAQQINFAERMVGKKIASQCKGKKARAFYGCLRTAGSKAYHSK